VVIEGAHDQLAGVLGEAGAQGGGEGEGVPLLDKANSHAPVPRGDQVVALLATLREDAHGGEGHEHGERPPVPRPAAEAVAGEVEALLTEALEQVEDDPGVVGPEGGPLVVGPDEGLVQGAGGDDRDPCGHDLGARRLEARLQPLSMLGQAIRLPVQGERLRQGAIPGVGSQGLGVGSEAVGRALEEVLRATDRDPGNLEEGQRSGLEAPGAAGVSGEDLLRVGDHEAVLVLTRRVADRVRERGPVERALAPERGETDGQRPEHRAVASLVEAGVHVHRGVRLHALAARLSTRAGSRRLMNTSSRMRATVPRTRETSWEVENIPSNHRPRILSPRKPSMVKRPME